MFIDEETIPMLDQDEDYDDYNTPNTRWYYKCQIYGWFSTGNSNSCWGNVLRQRRFWIAQKVKVITECIKNVCQNHQLRHGKILVLGDPEVSDATWSYVRRPELTKPEKFYLGKVSSSHLDLRNIIFVLKRIIRDLEYKRICLYDIDITRDFHGALDNDQLIGNLLNDGVVLAKEFKAVKTVLAGDETIKICKTRPHIAVQWFDTELKCWVGATFYDKVIEQWTSAGVR